MSAGRAPARDGALIDPVEIRAVVDRVAATFAEGKGALLTDPNLAREWCLERSEEFVELLLAEGVAAQTVSGAVFGEVPEFPGVELLLHGHVAALVCLGDPSTASDDADVVYDWTARQFDPECPVPLVQPVIEWRRRWKNPATWTAES